MEQRKITDADVEAIADAIQEKMLERFYSDLGRGLWGWIRKIVLGAVFAFAAYGAARGFDTRHN